MNAQLASQPGSARAGATPAGVGSEAALAERQSAGAGPGPQSAPVTEAGMEVVDEANGDTAGPSGDGQANQSASRMQVEGAAGDAAGALADGEEEVSLSCPSR